MWVPKLWRRVWVQGVGAEVGVLFGKARFGGGELNGVPRGGLGHRVRAAMHGLAQGDAGVFPSAANTGEKPMGIPMAGVKFAQAG